MMAMGDGETILSGYIRVWKVVLCIGENCYKKAMCLHITHLLAMKKNDHPVWNLFNKSPELWNESRVESSLSVLERSTRDSTIRSNVEHMSSRYQMVEVYRNAIKDMTDEVFDSDRLTDGGEHFEVKVESEEVTVLAKQLKKMLMEMKNGTYHIYQEMKKGNKIYSYHENERQHLERPSAINRLFQTNSSSLAQSVFDKVSATINKFPEEYTYIFALDDPLDGVCPSDDAILEFDHEDLEDLCSDDLEKFVVNVENDKSDDESDLQNTNEMHADMSDMLFVNDDIITSPIRRPDFDDIDNNGSDHDSNHEDGEYSNGDESDREEMLEEVGFKAIQVSIADKHYILKSARETAINSKGRSQSRILVQDNGRSMLPSHYNKKLKCKDSDKANKTGTKSVLSVEAHMSELSRQLITNDDDDDDDEEDARNQKANKRSMEKEEQLTTPVVRPIRNPRLRNVPVPNYNRLVRINGQNVEMSDSAEKALYR